MENAEGNVEIESIVDLEVEVSKFMDPTDRIVELHVAELNKEVDPILAEAAEVMAVGPWTDGDECSVGVAEYGQVAEGFKPVRGATAIQPSAAIGAIEVQNKQ